mgnify:CR=1 FL=1
MDFHLKIHGRTQWGDTYRHLLRVKHPFHNIFYLVQPNFVDSRTKHCLVYKCRGLSVFKLYANVLVFTWWYLNSGNSVVGGSIKFVSQHSGNTIFINMGKLFVCVAAVIILFILVGGKWPMNSAENSTWYIQTTNISFGSGQHENQLSGERVDLEPF